MRPKVSIVLPTHNMARYLGEAIQSLKQQTFEDWEAVVVDDGSEDDTARVVQDASCDRIRYVWQPHLGVAAARNAGVENSDGQYVAFLDADDVRLPRSLEEGVRVLEEHPEEVGLVFGQAYVIDANGAVRSLKAPRGKGTLEILPSQEALERLLRRNPITTSTVIVRRVCLERVGVFDTSMQAGGSDWELFLRVAACYLVAYIRRPLANYRAHAGGITASRINSAESLESRLRVLDQFFGEQGLGRRYGHLQPMARAALYYRSALLACERRQRRQALTYFVEAARLGPVRWGSRDGAFFAYNLAKSLLPAPLLRAGSRALRVTASVIALKRREASSARHHLNGPQK